MFKSKYSDSEKRKIVIESVSSKSSVKEICNKYGITAPTYYLWKKKYELNSEDNISVEDKFQSIESENKILRNLYINLSAHNYELAKFLEK